MIRFSFAITAFIVGNSAIALDAPPAVPQRAVELPALPSPTREVLPAPATPVQAPRAVVAPPVVRKVVCTQKTVAEIYTVTQLINSCGETLTNTGLRGVRNRRHACATESVLARVYANPHTCESCGSATRVSQIRCQRGDCCVCENDEYIQALVFDLASQSHRVRRASERSLQKCGLRVTEATACVTREVPSYDLY